MKLGLHVNVFGKYGCSSAFVYLHRHFCSTAGEQVVQRALIRTATEAFKSLWFEVKLIMSVEDRIYEVVDPKEPPRYPPGTKLSRSKTIGPMNPSRYNGGINGYAVPRSILSTTPPLPRTQPPSIPPRTRNYSEGEGALAGSPNDRVFRWGSWRRE